MAPLVWPPGIVALVLEISREFWVLGVSAKTSVQQNRKFDRWNPYVHSYKEKLEGDRRWYKWILYTSSFNSPFLGKFIGTPMSHAEFHSFFARQVLKTFPWPGGNRGSPKCMVYSTKSHLEMDDNWGTPISGNRHLDEFWISILDPFVNIL